MFFDDPILLAGNAGPHHSLPTNPRVFVCPEKNLHRKTLADVEGHFKRLHDQVEGLQRENQDGFFPAGRSRSTSGPTKRTRLEQGVGGVLEVWLNEKGLGV